MSSMWLAFLMVLMAITSAEASPNPVRRIITMLQMMQKKTEQENEVAKELYDKAACHCKTSLAKLRADIATGKETVPQLESAIEEAIAQVGNLNSDIKDAKEEVADAKKTLEEATSMRNKANKEFKAANNQMKTDVASLKKAITSMDRVPEGDSLLQTSLAGTIGKLVATSTDLSAADREVITNFLSETTSGQDGDSDMAASPQEITGILKQMAENMEKERQDAIADEASSLKQFESLKKAKETEMSNLRKDIQTKSDRVSKLNIQIQEDKQKLESTKKALESNLKLEAGLSKECKEKSDIFEEASRTRDEEQTAIADTISILNDDMAHHVFKDSFPAASFLQVEASPAQLKSDALQSLKASGSQDMRMNFVALALRSKKTSFSKVIEMVDGMIVLLKKEQQDDGNKRKYCKEEIDKTEDEKKDLEDDAKDLKKAIDQNKQKLNGLLSDIMAKSLSIKILDQQVSEATKQRKEEHEAFVDNLASNTAAKDILNVARARLEKFYSKGSLAQTGKRAHSKKAARHRSEHSPTQMTQTGKDLSELFSEGTGISFAQLEMQTESEEMRLKRKEDRGKVVTLINSLVADLEKQIQESSADEKKTQDEYEVALKESADKRAGDAKALSQLEGFKGEVEEEIFQTTGSKKSKYKEAGGKGEYLEDMHKDCDFILKHFETRRDARKGEVDALNGAKQTLTGADTPTFLQTVMRHSQLRGGLEK